MLIFIQKTKLWWITHLRSIISHGLCHKNQRHKKASLSCFETFENHRFSWQKFKQNYFCKFRSKCNNYSKDLLFHSESDIGHLKNCVLAPQICIFNQQDTLVHPRTMDNKNWIFCKYCLQNFIWHCTLSLDTLV